MIIAGTFPRKRTARPERRTDADAVPKAGDLPPEVPGPRSGDTWVAPADEDSDVQPSSPPTSEPAPNL
jgi:hypothetical protein